jgi:tight adherence protein C
MQSLLASLLQNLGLAPDTLIVAGAGLGALLLVLGLAGAFAAKDPVLRRLQDQGRRPGTAPDAAILRPSSADPRGLMRGFVPADVKTRSEVGRQLALAGFSGPHSVRNFYLVRLGVGIALPCLLLAVIAANRGGYLALPPAVDAKLALLGPLQLFQLTTVLVALGFFGPSIWLRGRVQERRRVIEESFPNALDLVQISVEAGLGFDAAMIRVANELEKTAPAIAQEFLTAQREIQAGRPRQRALLDMGQRTGVEEVTAFANVVLQAMQFGTSISDTLMTYAREMRKAREIRAQEQANKLPVKMSAVMATLMLPALVMLTLGPVVIRFIRYYAS